MSRSRKGMRAIAEQTISIVDLMYSQPVRSEACIAAQVSARNKFSMRPRAQGEGAVNYAKDIGSEDEDRMESGGTAGAISDAAGTKEHAREPYMSSPL
jgi:hypothetical protein